MSLEGCLALVTGSSRGIGRAIALRLAADGADVAINYRAQENLAASLIHEIRTLGRSAVAIKADVADIADAENLVRHVEASLGVPDIVVNNVGEFALSPVAKTPPEMWRAVLDSNLNSVYHVCWFVLPLMRAHGGGSIVNVGLGPAHMIRGAPNIAAYSIAKTGVIIFSKTLAIEEAANGIRANCVSPGLIDNGSLPVEQENWMAKRVPMGRLGRPEEVAAAISFLVSPAASYISGANLEVTGAWDWQDRRSDFDAEVYELFVRYRQ
jgi:NAD(P)-dependent dehydrogenase (short-subunit alcohol dehydrogenase family)